MTKMLFAPVALAATLVLGVSCGGSSTGESDPKPGTAWKDMKHGERLSYMKKTVLPRMKTEFVAFDSKDFGEMNCVTCHGDGAKDKSFMMPNPKLPKLPVTEEGFKQLSEKHPDAVKFMRTRVVPEMATLLGEAPFDPKTHQGFGCFECHPKEK